MSSRIPTLDIRRYDSDRDAFVAELGAAYREWGFAGISHHGIPQSLVDDAYEAFRRFFALPEEVKEEYLAIWREDRSDEENWTELEPFLQKHGA